MKKLFFLTISMVFAVAMFAADAVDVIITSDAKKIDAKILEVSKTEIKYKEADNLEGPTFIMETSEINSIIYASGKVAVFDHEPQAAPASYNAAGAKNNKAANENAAPEKKNVYQGYFAFTGTFGKLDLGWYGGSVARGGIEMLSTYGCRFNKYAFLGGGFGLTTDMYDGYYGFAGALSIPVYADIRGYAPTNVEGLYPHLGISIGPKFDFFQWNGENLNAGFDVFAYFRLYGGLDYKRFSFGLGYELWANADSKVHMGFISLGVRLGKNIY